MIGSIETNDQNVSHGQSFASAHRRARVYDRTFAFPLTKGALLGEEILRGSVRKWQLHILSLDEMSFPVKALSHVPVFPEDPGGRGQEAYSFSGAKRAVACVINKKV